MRCILGKILCYSLFVILLYLLLGYIGLFIGLLVYFLEG